jgi:hypothetical protein
LTGAYRPVEPAALAELLAERLDSAEHRGPALRVAIDGPRCAAPLALAESLVTPLRARGRPTATVSADSFWRDASLRLEHGREDVESFPRWLDDEALRREVLDRVGPDGDGGYLPSLRDPVTNRVTREPTHVVAEGAIVIVGGELLLGRGLPFDRTVHLSMSPAGRARRTETDLRWTLPAFDRYDADVRPAETADIVIRLDDPRHPAIRG